MAAGDSDPHSELMHALSALHVGGKYSDLTIICNYKQWAVHKAIVCSQSGFFDASMSHDFRETNSGVIDLSEDDEDAVEQMIHYFYHLDYLNETDQQPSALFRHRAYSNGRKRLSKKLDFSQIEDPLLSQAGVYAASQDVDSDHETVDSHDLFPGKSHQRMPTPPLEIDANSEPDVDEGENADDDDDDDAASTEAESHLLLHTQVYSLAEKYDIAGLKQLAAHKFEMAMACYYDAPEFADAVAETYCNTVDTDRGLRDIVLQAFRNHPQLANTQDVFAVIQETPSLALELFKLERGIPI